MIVNVIHLADYRQADTAVAPAAAIPPSHPGSHALDRRLRDLWIQTDADPRMFELSLPELPGVVGIVGADGDPGPSVIWFVEVDGKAPSDEHFGIGNSGASVDAAKAAVEDIMLAMLTTHRTALATR